MNASESQIYIHIYKSIVKQHHGGFTRWSVLNHIQALKIHQWRNENIEREKNDVKLVK